jgi:hypothetical protein
MYSFGVEVILIEPGYIVTNFQQTAKELAQPYVEAGKTGPYANIYSGAWAGANKGKQPQFESFLVSSAPSRSSQFSSLPSLSKSRCVGNRTGS